MLARSLIHSPKNSNSGPLVVMILVTFVALSAPFLFGYGTAPLTNFAGEIVSTSGFSTLMLVATLYGNFEAAHKHIKQLTAAIFLLIFGTLAQYFYFGSINTASWLIALAYLGMGWTAAWTGSAARSGSYADHWIKAICIGIAMGATMAALGSIAQFFNFDGGFIVLSPAQEAGRTFGFIRQPNHQGTFLNLGLASVAYLMQVAQPRIKKLLPIVILIIIFAILTTGSRTALIQVCFICLCIALTFKFRGIKTAIVIWLSAVIIWVLLYTINFFDVVNFYGAEKAAQTSSEGLGIRYALWRETWTLLISHPWTGSGLLYYGSDFILSGAAEKVGLPMTHSHNFTLQIIYAFGVPLSCIFFLFICKIFFDIRNEIFQPDSFLFICTIGCIGIHSLVEFPLWYTYFLLPLCFCIGWLEKRETQSSAKEKATRIQKKYVACIIGFGALTLVIWINNDYYKITPVYTAGLKSNLMERIRKSEQNFWFQPFSKFIALNRQSVNSENYKSYLKQAAINGCIMSELWYQPGTIVALTYAGKLDEAKWIIYSYWKLSGGSAGQFRTPLEISDAPSKGLILDFIENPHAVKRATESYEQECFVNRR